MDKTATAVYLAAGALAAFVGRQTVHYRAQSEARLDRLADQVEKLDKLHRDAAAGTIKIDTPA